jgi:signal transduction histidine kinase/ligand-binding sensor domain-containing protein/DNA-binding response OmpR family regulator
MVFLYIDCIMKQTSAKLYILFLISAWLISTSIIYPQSLIFNHLTVDDGLSNNDVNAVIQDKTGFIWFGTEDGLNRYDGYNFKIFRHDPSDSNSISGNSIWSLIEDHSGNIWIGTKGGILNKFNPTTEKFTRWEIKSNLTKENSVKSIYEDSKGNIWIGSYKDGLYRLNISTNRLDHWSSDINDDKTLSHNYVQAISEDNSGNILIGTYIGFNVFNPNSKNQEFKRYFQNENTNNRLSNNLIWALSKSTIDSNITWIGTYNNLTKFNSEKSLFEIIKIPNPDNLLYGTGSGSVLEEVNEGENIIWTDSYSGLLRMNLNTGKTTRFRNDENNPNSLVSNQINKIFKDRSGVIWIATENGISYITQKSTSFNSIGFLNSKLNLSTFFSKKNITAIELSNDNLIWVGTNDGLYSIENIKSVPSIKRHPKFNGLHIWSIASTGDNEMWIGTFGKGLKQFNYRSKNIIDWNLDSPRIRTESVYYNKTLLADSKKNIWVGYWGVGVARINLETGDYEVWLNDPKDSSSLSYNDVWVIKEDKYGRIWIGTTGGGLNLFEDRNGGMFHHLLEEGNSSNSLTSNDIYSIYESKNGKYAIDSNQTVLWIGTSNGLNQFIVKNKHNHQSIYDFDVEVNSFTVNEGLPDNSVNSILEDDNGNLWLGTGSGISFFDITNKKFTNYSSADGLSGTIMNFESALKLNNGEMLFGSTRGLNLFDPKKIKLSKFQPPVVFTDFQIFNESVTVGNNSVLEKSISISNEIKLSYNQDVFSLEFAALDYNSPKSIQYAYIMEGFDEYWINSGDRRFVTYTNLEPGNYTFKVKSTNADGVWNEKYSSIRFLIESPWWRTPWAYLSYVLLIGLGLFVIRRFELNRTKLRNELKLQQFEVEQKTKLEEIKSRFFANLSHEFRTPLMLIKGPLEQLKKERSSDSYFGNIDLIERNSDRLKELIDQLLELSQLEKAAIPLKAKQENVIAMLKGLLSSFESLAKHKIISIKFESDTDSKVCWIDRDKFEKIINNLLSNAFKFTSSGGEVIVGAGELRKDGKRYAEIKISDTGISIPKDQIDKIFDRFFQVDDSTQKTYGGSGIGLALVKEFIDLHKWKISVESEDGKGTVFKLLIPMWDYLEDDQKDNTESVKKLNLVSKIKPDNEHFSEFTEFKKQNEFDQSQINSSILIVDDSDDVRTYLSSLLKNQFTILEASNGEEGIIVATENIPDLIISDVMMTTMDGLEFCNRIKSSWQTSDIPVILLTAKASFESKMEGLEIGADDYLTKPFNSRELFTRIKNLLEQRKRLREKYSDNLNVLSVNTNTRLNKADNEFLEKTLALVEKNLDKTNFGTEQLANELFVSRTQLHRKIISITGQPPGELIRNKKLKHAAKLLLEGKLSVTQIAYEIGFSSPAQFTRAFTKQFNCVPSEYSTRIKF